jgi:hypothetical protein
LGTLANGILRTPCTELLRHPNTSIVYTTLVYIEAVEESGR